MKRFKFRYSVAVWVLLALVLLLSIISFCWNVYNVIHFKGDQTFKLISYYVIALITIFLSIFVVSIMAYGKYVVKKGFLYTYFGFIKSKTDINDISTVWNSNRHGGGQETTVGTVLCVEGFQSIGP